MKGKIPGHGVCLKGMLQTFDTHSYNRCSETDLNARVDVK